MGRRLGSTPFREILPGSISSDPTLINCADSLDSLLNNATQAIPEILLHARLAHDGGFGNPVPMLAPLKRLADLAGGLAELPDEILDLLAWQFHIEDYDTAISPEARRELIFSSILLHRRRGTPWAVLHALATALRVPATIQEWFQYGGEPYFFRVHLETESIMASPDWLQSAFQIIMDYKNVRSWLELISTHQEIRLDRYRGAGQIRQKTRSREVLKFFSVAPPVVTHNADPAVVTVTSTRLTLRFPTSRPPMARASIIGNKASTFSRVILERPEE